jgi:hypothetical protein
LMAAVPDALREKLFPKKKPKKLENSPKGGIF